MDPNGKFNGNTITVEWNPVESAVKYLVKIEQCQNDPCKPVFDEIVTNTTKLEMTDQDKFGPCTFYSLQVRFLTFFFSIIQVHAMKIFFSDFQWLICDNYLPLPPTQNG